MKLPAPHKAVLVAASLTLALGLSACGQDNNKPGGSLLETVGGASATDNTTVEKFNAYTKAFNGLIDDNWGVSEYYTRYQELNIPSKGVDGNIYFPENIGHLERMLATLKEGRALPSNASTAAADAAADKVITSGEALLALWKDLDPYYESRAYRGDNLAKGKAAHEQLLTAYRNAIAGVNALDEALTVHQRERNAAHAKALTKAGHADQALAVETMQIADYFTSAALEQNEPEADRLLLELEASLTKLRTTAAGLPDDDKNKRYYGNIADYLTSAIGKWRDYKQKKNNSDLESLLRSYNNAIGSFDDVEFSA